MKLQRASVLVLITAALASPLAACGDDTATADESTTTAAESGDTADLCTAAEAWNDTFDEQGDAVDTESASEMGDMLEAAAADFSENVVPAAPDSVRGDAADLGELMAEAGAELAAMDADSASPGELAMTGDAPKFAELMDVMQPQPVDPDDPESSTYRYANEFTAWMGDPCGPKDLEFEMESEFHSIASEI